MNTASLAYDKIKTKKFMLKINVTKVKSTLAFQVCLNTRIQNIIIKICKKIGIDHLNSNLQLYKGFSRSPLVKSRTLGQYKVKPGETLKCEIISANSDWTYYTKTHDFETVEEYKKYLPKKYIMPGMNLECMCVNPDCIEYGEPKVKPLGTGHFDINKLFVGVKCCICPDRAKGTNPPMAIKKVVFVSCYWRYEGKKYDVNGFEGLKFNKGWVRIENCDEKNFAKLMASEKWADMKIIIRGL